MRLIPGRPTSVRHSARDGNGQDHQCSGPDGSCRRHQYRR
ncbi:hypothetical protein RHECNPAF_2530096 [Rhizobium etli CNPAF512]|nr:hypothetical protein RHECNPAF_2530096 [Rhizobium etli CNPAF512]